MGTFQTTRWSLVLEAGTAQARPALEELCRVYRPPVLAFVRHYRRGRDDVEDLVQEFFLRFIQGDLAARADRERGRFRNFLLSALKHFLINAREHEVALKRGGGGSLLDIDAVADTVTAAGHTPDRAFELTWALTVIERALAALRVEAERAGKLDLFESVRPFLTETPDRVDYAEAAAALGMRANTLAVAVHRMRKRLRDKVRDELLDTLDDPGLLDEEMRQLRLSLASL
jgi:RNA polymerase sigma factor (sigma-70 family)